MDLSLHRCGFAGTAFSANRDPVSRWLGACQQVPEGIPAGLAGFGSPSPGNTRPSAVGTGHAELGTVIRLLADGPLGGSVAGLLTLIETPEALADTIGRARSQDYAKRRAHRCIEAVQGAMRLGAGRGITSI